MRLSELFSHRPEPPRVVPPPARDLEKALERVRRRWPDVVTEPPEKDRERLVVDLARRVAADDWTGMKMSLLNQTAIALFDRDRRARPDLADLREWYLREIRVSDRRSLLGGAFKVYVASFDAEARHTRALADALVSVRDRLPERTRRLLGIFPDLLDPGRAAGAVADRMLEMPSPYHDLKKLGISAPHAPGLMDAVHAAFLDRMRPRLNTIQGVEHLLAWLRPEDQPPRQSGAAEAITAILWPWRTRDPKDDLKDHLTHRLTELYHDPRVNPGGVWVGVDEQCKQVLLRWLTGESMRFLFDVLTESQDSHMWAARREFWMDQFERGNISAAWVAFGEEGLRLARRQMNHGRERPFARQVSNSGDDRNKSLLIMQVGQRIMIEGTHNFKVHIYRRNDPNAPRLYQPTYDCSQIRRDQRRKIDGQIRYVGPEERKIHLGDWQGYLRRNYPELS